MKTILALLLILAAPVRAEDGDTMWLDGRKVRLWGVDAPESKQPYGPEAKAALDAMRGEIAETIHMGTSYDRDVVVANTRNGSTVQVEMLRLGLVWIEPRYCRRCEGWREEEAKAKAARVGLWADDEPTPPWEWRRRK